MSTQPNAGKSAANSSSSTATKRRAKLTPKEKEEKAAASRLQPRTTVARALYLKSGNRCAFRGCPNVLINDHGVFIGEIAHICAASDGGPRADKTMSDEDRRAEKNLILLCRNDHWTIDSQPDSFPVADLERMKADHESIFARGTAQMFATGVEDLTSTTGWVPAETLAALPGHLDQMSEDDQAWNLELVNGFARRLARLREPARQLLAQVLIRGTCEGGNHHAEVAADAEVVRRTLGRGDVELTKSELLDLVAMLDEQGFAWLEDEEFDRARIVAGRSGGDSGWHLLEDIWVAASTRGTDGKPNDAFVRQVIVDLDLSVLDEP